MTSLSERPTLYAIGAEFRALEAALVESAGEITPDVEMKLLELGNLERAKIDGYRTVCLRFEHAEQRYKEEAARIKKEAEVWTAKATQAATAQKNLKARLLGYLIAKNVTTLEGEYFNASREKVGGVQRLSVLVDATRLPPAYQAVTVEPNNEALRGAMGNDGKVVVDGETIACLEPRGEKLVWR